MLWLGLVAVKADRSPANCSGSGLGINLFTSIPDVHIGDTLFYSVNVFNGIAGSGRIVCDATEIQAFIVTPDGKTNVVALRRTTLHQGDTDFYPDVVSYVVRAQDIKADGTILATARDIGVIHQNDVNSSGGGFQGVNTQVNEPCVQISALCVGGVGENGLITFTGKVTNCGNNTLVGVTVTNAVNNGFFTVLFPTNLAVGQVANFSGSWIPANPCIPSVAVLTVQASDEFTSTPRIVTSSATVSCQNVLTPGIRVTKECPAGPVAPGQLVVFTGSVINTGNITLTNIVVVNDRPSANTAVFTLASLAPGAVAKFSGSYPAPTNCAVTDTLLARASGLCGGDVSSSASATCAILTTPAILVVANCPTTPPVPGGLVLYNGSVQNVGNISLTNVVVTSDRPVAGTVVFRAATLAPGAVAPFTASYTVPADVCSIATIFSGTAQDLCSLASVVSTATPVCTVTTVPAVVVTLACPATPVTTGGLISFTGTVRNTGNVTLKDVYVVNNQPAAVLAVIGPITLAPGASVPFVASFTSPSDACSVSTTVTARGTDNCGTTSVTSVASATCTLLTTPAIVVTQACVVTSAVPGGLLSFTGTVRNTGNITLTNVVVLNNLSGVTPVFTALTLAPGASAAFTGSYLAPTNCSSTSIATATGTSLCGVPVSNSVVTTCLVLTTPSISVTAVCPPGTLVPGGLVTYTGTVRNTGNITLTNVVVTSDRPAANTTFFTVASLVPGASANFTASYTIPADVCSITTTFTGSGKDVCTQNPATSFATTVCAVTTAPAVTITLACPPVAVGAGIPVSLTGTVRNSGNVTLTNIRVTGNQPGAGTPVLGPITLAPGASAPFTVLFSAPADACSVSTTVNVTAANACSTVEVSDRATASCALITTPGLVLTQACPTTPPGPGGLLSFTGTVRNSGDVTLTNIVVLNNQSGSTPIFKALSLTPGAVVSFTGSYLVATNCSTVSISTATAASICGVSVTNTASSTCPILTTPAIGVTQVCPTGSVLQGGVLTYTGIVRNLGNITLTNVIVTSDRPGKGTVIFTQATLAVGASASFNGSYSVPTNCCVVSSTVQATGQGCAGETVSDTDTRTCTVLTTPKLVITKTCPPLAVHPGELLTYTGSITNVGNITLVQVTVIDPMASNGAPVLGPITLAPGESAEYTVSLIVPKDYCDSGSVTVSGMDVCTFQSVSSVATSSCLVINRPRILVTKNCPLLPTARGGLFTFTGTVSNPGDVTLVNVYVTDNQPTNNTPVIGPITLAPGASVDFTGSYIAPHCCCLIIDTLTARGQDRCTGTNVVFTATAVCPLLSNPALTLLPNCPTSPIPMGSVFAFSGRVSNTGDVVMTNVFVFGPQGTNSPVLGPLELAPGESAAYSGTYTVPFNSCSVQVTASGRDTCGDRQITSSASCPVATLPAISVTETCPPGPVPVGSLVVFGGSVKNTGNVSLTNVLVFSSRATNAVPVLGPITLEPGASVLFTGSYTAVAGSSQVTNTVTATGVDFCLGATVRSTADCSSKITPSTLVEITGSPSVSAGNLKFTFPSVTGKSYLIQTTTSLSGAAWTDLKTIPGTGSPLEFMDPVTSGRPMQFYRIIEIQ